MLSLSASESTAAPAYVDNRESLTKLRKIYRKLAACYPALRDGSEPSSNSRVGCLLHLTSMLAVWRLAGGARGINFQALASADLKNTKVVDAAKIEQGVADFYQETSAALSFRVPAPLGFPEDITDVVKLLAHHESILNQFGCRASGYFYQFFAEVDRKRAQKQMEEGDKRATSEDLIAFTQIYTPDAVVDYLLRGTISGVANNASTEFGYNIRLLDPSCGCGNFLIPAFDRLVAFFVHEKGMELAVAVDHVLANCLSGTDIDSTALWICGAQLLVRAREISRGTKVVLSLHNVSVRAHESDIESGSLCRDWPDGHVLSKRYDIVVTNPPYLGRRLLDRPFKHWLKQHYPLSRHDLSAAFVQRATELLDENGRLGFITQSSLLYLPSYAKLRELLLRNFKIVDVVELGAGAFPLQGGEKVNSMLLVIEKNLPTSDTSITYHDARGRANSVQSLLESPPSEDTLQAPSLNVLVRRQHDFLSYDNCALTFDSPDFLSELLRSEQNLGVVCEIKQGLATSDNSRFLRYWWDVDPGELDVRWKPYMKGAGEERWWAPVETVVDWGADGQSIKDAVAKAYPYLKGKTHWVVKNETFYFREGISFSFINTGSLSARDMPAGCIFDVGGSAVFPKPSKKYATLAWLNSSFAGLCAKTINPTLNLQVGDLRKLPLLIGTEQQAIAELAERCCELKRNASPSGNLDLFHAKAGARTVNGADAIQLCKSRMQRLDSAIADVRALELQIDELVLDSVCRHAGLDLGQERLLRSLSEKHRTKSKMWCPARGEMEIALTTLLDLIVGCLGEKPAATWTALRTKMQLSREVENWFAKILQSDLCNYMRKRMNTAQSELYRGNPRIICLPVNDHDALLVSVRHMRTAMSCHSDSWMEECLSARDRSAASDALSRLVGAFRAVNVQPDWTSAALLKSLLLSL